MSALEKKKFDSIVGDLSREFLTLSASGEALNNVSEELMEERNDAEELELLTQVASAAQQIVENGLFDNLTFKDYPSKGWRALLGIDKRKWKVITFSGMGQKPTNTNDYFTITHPLRYFLLSDAGELGVAPVKVRCAGRLESITPEDEVSELAKSGYALLYPSYGRIEDLTLENAVIEYKKDGLACYKNMAVAMLDTLVQEVQQVVETKNKEVLDKEEKVRARF